MSALSFSAAVAARPVLVGDVTRASSRVNKETRAIGGFGPNIPADEYKKKMEAKKKLIEEKLTAYLSEQTLHRLDWEGL